MQTPIKFLFSIILFALCTVSATFAQDVSAPSVPTNLEAESTSTTSITLTWDASTDDVGVSQYRVEYCDGYSCSDWELLGTTANTTLTHSGWGPEDSQIYRYRVRAEDAATNASGWSDPPVYGTTSLYVANVVDFGAVGDGVADDTTAIQQAINFQRDQGGGEVYVPAGTYLATMVNLYSNITLRGDGPTASILKQSVPNNRNLLQVNWPDGGTPNIADNQRNIIIRDLQLRGTVEQDGLSQHRHLLSLSAISDALVENVHFIGMRGDGIYLGSSNIANVERHNTNVVVRGCLFDGLINDNRQAISIIDGDNVVIENNVFDQVSRPDMPAAIDIEPDNSFFVARDIVIRNNVFRRTNGLSSILWWTPNIRSTERSISLSVIGNTFEATARTNGGMPVIGVYTAQQAGDPPMSITIEDNTILSANSRGLGLSNVFDNVSIQRNTFRNGREFQLGYRWPENGTAIEDVIIRHNVFDTFNSWNMLSFWNPKNVIIEDNVFSYLSLPPPPPSPYTFIYFYTPKTVESNVRISDNNFYKGSNTYSPQVITNWNYTSDPGLYYGNSLADGFDVTAPVISSPLPTGEQASGTTSVTLQVTTDEPSTCRYSAMDVAYASMGSTFGSTGGTTHQQTGFPTSDGLSYTRYVRCQDGSGNANSSSAVISWTVAARSLSAPLNLRILSL